MSGPSSPVVAVGGLAVIEGEVVLIRRAKPPLMGSWSIPGGRVELGECLGDALVREMHEETGLVVRPGPLLLLFDRIEHAPQGVLYHFVIADYLVEVLGGELKAGSDATDVARVGADDLPRYALTAEALDVARRALAWRR